MEKENKTTGVYVLIRLSIHPMGTFANCYGLFHNEADALHAMDEHVRSIYCMRFGKDEHEEFEQFIASGYMAEGKEWRFEDDDYYDEFHIEHTL